MKQIVEIKKVLKSLTNKTCSYTSVFGFSYDLFPHSHMRVIVTYLNHCRLKHVHGMMIIRKFIHTKLRT